MRAKSMLPIDDVLDPLCAALSSREAAVLVAPPGAGKTTRAPLALLDTPWAKGGKLILLEPRRLAARSAAARMAAELGETVGATVGFRVRMQSEVSARTRIEVVTEGVFTRMILADPALDGVAGVIFDEFHERSLDADLGLALARDAQAVLRSDLKLLVMSATLDGARVSALLDDAPVVESAGRAFPVETRHLARDAAQPMEAQVARAVRQALGETEGGMLVFLPGVAEISRVETLLRDRFDGRGDVQIAPLYGAMSPEAQDLALAPPAAGVRKVVLATSIAETSLTLAGVRVVVDAGLARVPHYDPASGLTRLRTVRVSRAAADQRRGRAGRTAPGVCYRLWDEAETRALAPFARPEILDSDLSRFALDLAQWGTRDGVGLALLDPPPAGAFAEARALLTRLGALDGGGALTDGGRRLARAPLPPRLGHLIVEGAARGAGARAAHIAAVLSERGLGGEAVDLSERLHRFAQDRSARASEARALAQRWLKAAGVQGASSAGSASDGVLLALAYPERVAQARGAIGHFALASGRGVQLDPAEPLAASPWLVVGDLGGGDRHDRVRLAAAIAREDLEALFADRIETVDSLRIDDDGRVSAERRTRLGALVLDARRLDRPPAAAAAAAQLAWVRTRGLGVLRLQAADTFRARIAFVRSLPGEAAWPDLSDARLLADLDAWLGPLLDGVVAPALLPQGDLAAAVEALAPYAQRIRLNALAPTHFVAPTGSSFVIDYAAEGGPRVEVRVQELFGLREHPTVAAGRTPLTLALLSPARRPVQVTRDLSGFWAGSWKAVRAEMRGRYPKHPWPDDPTAAPPTTRAKPKGT